MALWERFAEARGHQVLDQASFLAIDSGGGAGGLRILIRDQNISPDDGDVLAGQLRSNTRSIVVEDPFDAADLAGFGLVKTVLPIMARTAGQTAATDPGTGDVARVTDREALASLERLIVEDFPTSSFAPYRAGEMLPPSLLLSGGVEFYGIRCEGMLAGGCMTMTSDSATGIYWVVINRDFRGRGLGRKLITQVLQDNPRRTMTLTATPAGEPLYRSLGISSVAPSTWWMKPSH